LGGISITCGGLGGFDGAIFGTSLMDLLGVDEIFKLDACASEKIEGV
jgi:hypothetical protein